MAGVVDIMFKINSSLGPGGLTTLVAARDTIRSLGGAVVGLGKDILNTFKEFERFNIAINALEVDISRAIVAMQGMISAQTMVSNANKITEAGLEATADQFTAINKAAFNYAMTTGRDVTEATNSLTYALIIGSKKALKRYGIDLGEAEGQAEKFAEGLRQVEEISKDLIVQTDKVSLTFTGFKNSIDSFSSILYGKLTDGLVKSSSGMQNLTKSLNEANAAMLQGRHYVTDYLGSLGSFVDFFTNIEMWRIKLLAATAGDIAGAYTEKDAQAIEKAKGYLPYTTMGEATGKFPWDKRGKSVFTGADADASKKAMSYGRSAKAKKEKPGRVVPELSALLGGAQDISVRNPEAWAKMQADAERMVSDEAEKSRKKAEDQIKELIRLKQRNWDLEDEGYILTKKQADMTDRQIAREVRLGQVVYEDKRRNMELQAEGYRLTQKQLTMTDKQIQREMKLGHVEQDRAIKYQTAFEDAFSSVNSAGIAANGVLDTMQNALSATATAAIISGENVGQALMKSVQASAVSIAVEATLRALIETAKSVADYASYNYPGGSAHAGAAAEFVATAAIAGAVAGGSTAIIKSNGWDQSKKSKGGGGGGGSVPRSYGGDKQKNQNNGPINLTVQLDGEVLTRAVYKQNEKNKRSGRKVI